MIKYISDITDKLLYIECVNEIIKSHVTHYRTIIFQEKSNFNRIMNQNYFGFTFLLYILHISTAFET